MSRRRLVIGGVIVAFLLASIVAAVVLAVQPSRPWARMDIRNVTWSVTSVGDAAAPSGYSATLELGPEEVRGVTLVTTCTAAVGDWWPNQDADALGFRIVTVSSQRCDGAATAFDESLLRTLRSAQRWRAVSDHEFDVIGDSTLRLTR